MMAAMEFCLVRRSDDVVLGCWPWWATLLPFIAFALLLYLLLREKPGPKPWAHECDDCGYATFNWIDKSDHHGGTKRVCEDRVACHGRCPWG